MKKCAANIRYHLAWAPKVKLVRYKRDNNNDSNESGIANIVFLFFEKTGLQRKLISQLYWFYGILFSYCNYFRDFENCPFLIQAATFCSIRIKLLWNLLLRFWHFLRLLSWSIWPSRLCAQLFSFPTERTRGKIKRENFYQIELESARTFLSCWIRVTRWPWRRMEIKVFC